ncbi:E3 ubiquitin-protein ligase HOS1-like isoform X8 [Typha angustifolia]|uniref:E3 ubiquitin-protein ligase HOS1-like isoform X8 n=1 Tax=Typha angustifolia TaxID=59011 RepID=UPI003C2DDC7D
MDALEHLASIDLIELCNEAKIERCRATRDLSSCGRYVQHVLTSCGHASLCAECCQRCDVCPICRTSIPTAGSRVRLRLYYKCIDAGLISKNQDDMFQEKDSRNHVMTDIQRLYSLFDVALENNLVSLICHYGVGVQEMKSKLDLFQKFAMQLTGISSVLEIMVLSFKETVAAQVHDLHQLLESTMKAKQHLEVMIWCIRHQFLEGVQSRFPNVASWKLHVLERKLEAVRRAWPDYSNNMRDSFGPNGTILFIEQALANLRIEQSYIKERVDDVDISSLQDENSPSLFLSKIDEANRNGYPFKSLRTAADVLFLHGISDTVVAKQAILLYYLFDRHWSRPDVEWQYLIHDFSATFGITRHSVLESLVFFLLDDHTFEALQVIFTCFCFPSVSLICGHDAIMHDIIHMSNIYTSRYILRAF